MVRGWRVYPRSRGESLSEHVAASLRHFSVETNGPSRLRHHHASLRERQHDAPLDCHIAVARSLLAFDLHSDPLALRSDHLTGLQDGATAHQRGVHKGLPWANLAA